MVKKMLVIEFNGRQHYQVVNRSKNPHKNQSNFDLYVARDSAKRAFCQNNDIPLLEIRYDNPNINGTMDKFLQVHNLLI